MIQTAISLLMQAAANRPINFSDFGISADTHAATRRTLLESVETMPEDLYWSGMAAAAAEDRAATGKPFGLADHYFFLSFLLEFFAPLYAPEPVALDAQNVTADLAARIEAARDVPPTALYESMMELVPEETGANRLLRIFLAKSAIGHAIAATQS